MYTRIFAPITEDLLKTALAGDRARLGRMATRPSIFRLEVKHLELALETRGVDPQTVEGKPLTESQAEDLRIAFIECYGDAARAMPRSQLASFYVALAIAGYYDFASVFSAQMAARNMDYTALNYFKQAISDHDEALTLSTLNSSDDLALPVLHDPSV